MKREKHIGIGGYTLLEMLVTVAIIGFLVAMGIPAWIKMQPHLRLKTASRDVADVMHQARMYAVANNKYTDVKIYEDANTVTWRYLPDGFEHSIDAWVDVDIYDGSGITGGGDEKAPYPVSDATFGRYIRFRPDGTTTILREPNITQEAVYFRNKRKPNEYMRVKVTTTGIISIETKDSSNHWR